MQKEIEFTARIMGNDMRPIDSIGSKDLLLLAQKKYFLRRRRSNALYDIADLFHDPAWDILLDLFIAAETNAQISVSSACIASGVPSTTALRAINIMEQRGIIKAADDPLDARRRFVSLSDAMRQQMRELLSLW